MKILRAEKLKPRKRSESKRTKSESTLRKTDWEVLVQTDRSTGKLNLRSTAALKDPGSVKRLLEAGMIDPNGKLTAKGKKKCDGLIKKLMKPESESAAVPELPKAEPSGEPEDKQIDKLTASDWAVLMKYDRKTGNLLTYDPVTNEMDQTSRAILKDPAIIQRLIDNNMILPGGWLTPEAKEECKGIEAKLKNQPADGYAEQKESAAPNLDAHPNPEQLSKGERQSKDTPQSKGAPEAKMDTDPESERFSDKLSKIRNSRKDQSGAGEPASTKPEATAAKVSQPHAIQQHYPDPKDKILAEDEPKPSDPSEPAPKAWAENKKLDEQDMQAFFEQLPVDHPDPNLDPERQSNGEHPPKKKQRAKSSPEPVQKKEPEKTREVLGPAETPHKETASNRTLRNFDLKAVSRPEGVDEKRSRRRKKDSGGSGGDVTEPPRFSLRDVFHIVFKRKIEIFLFFIAVLFTVVIGTIMIKPTYEALAQLLIKPGRESVFIPTSGKMNPVINFDREERINSEIQILKSRALAEKVVTALGPTEIYESLKEDDLGILRRLFTDTDAKTSPEAVAALRLENAIADFQEALSVEAIKNSNVIQIKFEHENANMCAMVINNLAENYLEHHLEVHKTPQNVKFFQEQTDLLKNKLEKAEERLKALRKRHNITALDEQRTLLLGRSSVLNSGLNETISLEVETEKRIRLLRRQLASVPQTISLGEETDQNQNPYLINTLEARLVELQLKEKELLTKYTDQSRLVQNVKEEIRVVEQKLEEHSTKRYGRKTSGVNPTHQRLKEELFSNEAELEALKAKKITQKEHLEELQVKLGNLNRVELELKQLEQDIEVDQENYRLYLSKVEESRISDAMDSEKIANVSLIQPASAPQKPVSPKKMLNLIIAIFIGTFGGFGLAFFMEYLDDKIEKIEDVEVELQLPVLASIPIFKQKAAST